MKQLILFALLALSGCASMSPEEISGLTYDSPLSPRQVYERFTERCGIAPKDTGWTNGAGNGFGMEATYDAARNAGLVTYYHISFGVRSEPGSFWDRTFGQVVTISAAGAGSHIELRGQTASHLMRSKYREIGDLLKKESSCPA